MPSASDQAYGAHAAHAGQAGTNDAVAQVTVRREVDGVIVFAPPGVRLAAIDECATFITEEIGRNEYAQDHLRKVRATIVIIPANEPMTSLPQFAGLSTQKTFDGRDWTTTRGSGGMQAPDGSFAIGVAEENLVSVKGVISQYPSSYSIGMHEFAHAVNNRGMTPEQQERLKQIYNKHIAADPGDKAGTFTDKYASSNYLEYFAQATDAYFGRNQGEGHNGRDWLQKNDPDMFQFLEQMYDTSYDARGDVIGMNDDGKRMDA